MNSRTNPFDELERLFDRMSQQFDEASNRWESEGPFGPLLPSRESMAIDLVDRDDEFVATVDLPGFDREEVDIRVADHTLRIVAEREEVLDEEADQYIHHERHHESNRRSIRLPEEVETENVTARMKNGVLTITLPKRDIQEASSIQIEGE